VNQHCGPARPGNLYRPVVAPRVHN
jgi:hypothetical protein